MKVFISYVREDKKQATLIADKVREAGHDVLYDAWALRPGVNLIEKVNASLKDIDALIVVVSKHALESKWGMYEFSAIALGALSSKKSRIIPVLVDKSSIPQYLARYAHVDLTDDFAFGIEKIVYALLAKPVREPSPKPDKKQLQSSAIASLSRALHAGQLTLICGAGVSIDAGIPSWSQLLVRLLESMIKRVSQDRAIPLDHIAPEEFQRRYGPSALVVGKYLKSNLGNDFMPALRDALYSEDPTSCEIIEAIVELARPQRDGKPLESIITFNFDGLIEELLERHNIRHRPIFSEGIRNRANELPVYHVHGFLPRKGRVAKEVEVVFSEDAYHSQFIDPFSWSNLIQLHKLSQNTCLFIGLSLTDPNLRRLLDVANRKNPSRSLNHFIIKKAPHLANDRGAIDQLAFLLEEQDANELGLSVVWIDSFSEVAPFLKRVTETNV